MTHRERSKLNLTFGASDTFDLLGVCAHVIDNRSLEVRHFEVPSFTVDGLLDAIDLVKLEGTVTRFDCL